MPTSIPTHQSIGTTPGSSATPSANSVFSWKNIAPITAQLNPFAAVTTPTTSASVSGGKNVERVRIVPGGENVLFMQYIIVMSDGSCLEMEEQNVLTAREMLGLCKFINMTQIALSLTGVGLDISWSDLAVSLGIDRHFSPGYADWHQYETDGDTLYVFLFDPPQPD